LATSSSVPISTGPSRQPPLAERFVEQLLFASRWLLAPIYLGLSLALLALGIKFFQELWHLLPNILSVPEAEMILVVLTLVDLSLVGGLLVMVMFSSYENFVSRIDATSKEQHELGWMGKLDAGGLKLKVATSIVAISSIHLLKAFMNAPDTPNDKLMWYSIIHMVFVLSALLLGYSSKVADKH
jgi:uncharacterized protein (TIGR00645 family)